MLQAVPKDVRVGSARMGALPVQRLLFLLRALILSAGVAAHRSSAQLSCATQLVSLVCGAERFGPGCPLGIVCVSLLAVAGWKEPGDSSNASSWLK